MSYIGTEPKDIRSFGRTKFDYTASQGQTAFTGADDDGKVLAFTTGQINVYVNGILMDDSDFTTTGTGTVTLASAANLNDVVNIVSFESNIPDNDYVPASGGTFTGNVTNSGTVTNSGNVTVGGTLGVTGNLTANSQVGIGSAPVGSETLTVAKSSGTPTIRVNAPSGSEAQLKLQANGGGTTIPLIAAKTDGALSFSRWTGAAYTERMRILPDGGLTFNGDTAASNALDDYEEGEYTPLLYGYTTGSGTLLPLRSSHNALSYTKVGRKVTVNGKIETSGSHSATGSLLLSIPFTAANLTDQAGQGAGACFFYRTGQLHENPTVVFGEAVDYVYFFSNTSGGDVLAITANVMDAAIELIVGFTYFTS